MFSLARKKRVVGLDIGSSSVKAVELKAVGAGYRLVAFACEPIPRGSIADGAIKDPAAVVGAIRRLFEYQSFTTKEVAASLSGNAVIVKKIALPAMTDRELGQAIQWEAEEHIPFDIQDVHLDYDILGPWGRRESTGAMGVLLVAAKKDKVAGYASVITEAGRVPVVMDVDAFALQNAYELNYGLQGASVVALANVGASAVNINVVGHGQSLFSRDISTGGNAYTGAVQKELNLSFERAEVAKRGVPIPGVTFDELRPVLATVTHTLTLEIQKTLDFFETTSASDRIDRIALSGGASLTDGFVEALESRTGVSVERIDPFRNIEIEASTLRIDAFEQMAPTAAVAVGLALRSARNQ